MPWTELGQQVHGPDGFVAVVYTLEKTHEIVVAYRGTDQKHLNDWEQNAQNAAGLKTSQGEQAIALAQQVVAQYGPSYDVSFTGHSLGGSLASLASIATGRPATTFNAAGVGQGNYDAAIQAGHGAGAAETQITNYHTTYDILSNEQKQLGLTPASGTQVTIGSNTTDPIKSHDLNQFHWPSSARAGKQP